jgi:hypothetical protein
MVSSTAANAQPIFMGAELVILGSSVCPVPRFAVVKGQ